MWLDARPAVLDDLASQAGRHHGHRGGGGNGDRLARLVEDGVITQAQADEITAWRDARPEALDLIRPHQPGGQGHYRGRGQTHGQFTGHSRGTYEGEFQGRFSSHFPGGPADSST